MKRTSFLVLIACVMTQQIASASHRVPARYRVGYSMHAFSHDYPSGLVSGRMQYSPYAFGVNNPGLVDEYVRYSPYAFSPTHNGLISDYGPCTNSTWLQPRDRTLNQQKLTQAIEQLAHSIDTMKSSRRTTHSVTYGAYPAVFAGSQTVNVQDLRSDNPRLLIRAHLNTVIPGQYKVSKLLRVDQEVVSFNVIVENRNLIIKYWNPAKIQSIKEASDQKTERLSDYMKEWAATENFYEKQGERVVHIVATDQDKIIGELASCLQTKTM
ncbi:MAG: hypothetical protein K9N55_11280 [Phycisphaerae bacterium]|nr:hypothetical protein [Phycisphaerae bacterium]